MINTLAFIGAVWFFGWALAKAASRPVPEPTSWLANEDADV